MTDISIFNDLATLSDTNEILIDRLAKLGDKADLARLRYKNLQIFSDIILFNSITETYSNDTIYPDLLDLASYTDTSPFSKANEL